MEEVKEKIKQATRHFAKRQWTWFKKEKGIRWVWWPETAALADVSDFIIERSGISEEARNRKQEARNEKVRSR